MGDRDFGCTLSDVGLHHWRSLPQFESCSCKYVSVQSACWLLLLQMWKAALQPQNQISWSANHPTVPSSFFFVLTRGFHTTGYFCRMHYFVTSFAAAKHTRSIFVKCCDTDFVKLLFYNSAKWTCHSQSVYLWLCKSQFAGSANEHIAALTKFCSCISWIVAATANNTQVDVSGCMMLFC